MSTVQDDTHKRAVDELLKIYRKQSAICEEAGVLFGPVIGDALEILMREKFADHPELEAVLGPRRERLEAVAEVILSGDPT
jgi:hypothetical protein